MAIVATDSKHYTNIAEAIRQGSGETDLIYPADMPEKISGIAEAGRQVEYNKSWNAFTNNGSRRNYKYAFAYGWSDETCRPNQTIKATNIEYIFAGSGVVNAPPIDVSEADNINNGFRTASVSSATLIGVHEELGFTTAFAYANSLTHLVIEGVIGQDINFQHCPLDKESIVNIITVSSLTASFTITLSEAAVDRAFETAEGLADGSTSQEWSNLIATRPNCTISLI